MSLANNYFITSLIVSSVVIVLLYFSRSRIIKRFTALLPEKRSIDVGPAPVFRHHGSSSCLDHPELRHLDFAGKALLPHRGSGKELEKKNSELDALKKERASTQQNKTAPAVEVAVSTEPLSQQGFADENSIQVVRNVGGVFKPATVEGPYGPGVKAEKPAVIIPLFSPLTGGADFNTLYRALVEFMKSRRDPLIAFDCANISTLSDPDVDYIEKLYQSLLNHKRSLLLLNCSSALSALFQRRPLIAALVR